MKKSKRLLGIALCGLMALTGLAPAASAAPVRKTAIPSRNAIYVDGERVPAASYLIDGNNYFKLRDIASMVNYTDKQFSVSWDARQQYIYLTSGERYRSVGGELDGVTQQTRSATASTSPVYKDGSRAYYTGYLIGGNNYYRLRDLCSDFNIGVLWDAGNNRVDILTDIGYGEQIPTGPETTALTDLKPFQRSGVWERTSDTDNYGQTHQNILGYSSFSSGSIEYLLDGEYDRFEANLFVPQDTAYSITNPNHSAWSNASVTIYADGSVIYSQTGGFSAKTEPIPIDLDITGVQFLKIVFEKTGAMGSFGLSYEICSLGDTLLTAY